MESTHVLLGLNFWSTHQQWGSRLTIYAINYDLGYTEPSLNYN